ncbi:MAG: hypothetical protein R6W78_19520 [Bacteroidales bacterium]
MKKLTSTGAARAGQPLFESTFGFCVEDLMGLTRIYRSTSRKIYRLRPEYSYAASRQLAEAAADKQKQADYLAAYRLSEQSLLNHTFNANARHTLACSLEALGYHDEALEQYRFALLVGQGNKRAESLRAATRIHML